MRQQDKGARALFAVIAHGEEYEDAPAFSVVADIVAVVVVTIAGEEIKWRSTKQYSSAVS